MRRLLALPLIGVMVILAACGAPSSATQPSSNPAPAAAQPATAPATSQLETATPASTETVAAPAAAATETALPPTPPPVAAAIDAPAATAQKAEAAASAVPAATAAAVAPAGQNNAGPITMVTVPDGTQASYKVREQLARRNFPNDAVGTTKDVTGSVVINPDGTLVPGKSRFVVNLTTLRTDSRDRDRYVQRNTLDTAQYPEAVFVPTSVKGLPSPLPPSGDVKFQIVGDLTMHGTTHPTTWDATAHIDGQDLTGSATTTFTFEDVGLEQPRAFVVLSVEDHITLQIDYHLRAGSAS